VPAKHSQLVLGISDLYHLCRPVRPILCEHLLDRQKGKESEGSIVLNYSKFLFENYLVGINGLVHLNLLPYCTGKLHVTVGGLYLTQQLAPEHRL
jgi:hypothetical protein